MDMQHRVITFTERFLKDEAHSLAAIARRLAFIPMQMVAVQNSLELLKRDIIGHIRQLFLKTDSRLDSVEQAVRLLDPVNVLRRGYSITRHNGKVLKDAAQVKKGAVIDTMLYKGSITSVAGQAKEVKKQSEQKQAADLLPGFD